MKKIIAALTALMLCGTMLTACGKKTADEINDTLFETTTAAETTAEVTAAETEAKAEEAETEATTGSEHADNSGITDEMKATLEILDKESPVYANYIRESVKFPVLNTFEYDETTDDGEQHIEFTCAIADATKIAVKTKTSEGSFDIILSGNKYYIVSPEERSAIFMEIPNDDLEETKQSLNSAMNFNIDAANAVYEKGEGEVNGETLPYEKITTVDGDVFCFYYEEGTMDIKYLVSDDTVMKMTNFTHDVDDSIFEIPADYELIDFAAALGELGSALEE